MTNCPDLSATARSCPSPSRSSSTVAPGAARPATTVSPVGSMLTTSNVGTPSPLSGGGCDPIRALATAFASDFAVASGAAIRSCASDPGLGIAGAAVASLTSAGGSRWKYWMAKATLPAATTANEATTIRVIDMAVTTLTPLPEHWLIAILYLLEQGGYGFAFGN